MLKMHLAAGLAAAALMTTAAVAQTSAPTVPAGQGQLMTQMPPDMMRGSQLTRLDVYGSDNQRIGGIDEVIVDRQGKIHAIVVGIGGFLGIGQKDVAIPFDQVQWMTNQEVQAQSNQGGGGAGGAGGMSGSTTGTVGGTSSMALGTGSGPGGSAGTAAGGVGGGPAGSTAGMAGGAGGGTGGTTGSTASTPAGAGGTGGTATSNTGGGAGGPAGAGASGMTAGGTGAGPGGGASGRDANMPARAMVRMTKADLQNAPEFRYNANEGSQSGSGGATGGGAGGAGATGGGTGGAGAGGTTAPRP